MTPYVGAQLAGLGMPLFGGPGAKLLPKFLTGAKASETIATAALGMLSGSGSLYEQAKAAYLKEGKSEREATDLATEAADWGGMVGSMIAIPLSKVLNPVSRILGTSASRLIRTAASAADGAIEFPVFMGIMRTLDNAIAKMTYDQKRELFQGMAEGAPADAILGALFHAVPKMHQEGKAAQFEAKSKELFDLLGELGAEERAKAVQTMEEVPAIEAPEIAQKKVQEVFKEAEPLPLSEETQAKRDKARDAALKRVLKKEVTTTEQADKVIDYFNKTYGVNLRYERDLESGKYYFVEGEKPLSHVVEQAINKAETASEVPEDVPVLTPERTRKKETPRSEQDRFMEIQDKVNRGDVITQEQALFWPSPMCASMDWPHRLSLSG